MSDGDTAVAPAEVEVRDGRLSMETRVVARINVIEPEVEPLSAREPQARLYIAGDDVSVDIELDAEALDGLVDALYDLQLTDANDETPLAIDGGQPVDASGGAAAMPTDAGEAGGEKRIDDRTFDALMSLMMVSDPWPIDLADQDRIDTMLNREARARGYDGWIQAYNAEFVDGSAGGNMDCSHSWRGVSANIHDRTALSECVSAVVEQCVHCSKYRLDTDPEFVDESESA